VECNSPIIAGISRVTTTTCKCPSTLVWNSVTQSCICRPGSIANNGKCTKCSTIQFSTIASVLGVSCICNPTFVWKATTLTCGCNSNSVLSPIVAKKQTCINCDQFVGSDGIDPLDATQCHCMGDLIWDSLKKTCLCPNSINSIISPNATCIICNTATDPNIISPPVDAYNCRCADPYFWDSIQMMCVKCSDLSNGVSKKKGAELICTCKRGYYFDVFTNQCKLTPQKGCTADNMSSCLNCAYIPYSDPTSPPLLLDSTKYFNSKSTSAVIRQYSSISSTLTKYRTYQCLCSGGFFWEPTRKRCETVFE
jgi:hypothetical protein